MIPKYIVATYYLKASKTNTKRKEIDKLLFSVNKLQGVTSAAKDRSLSILHYLWGTKYLISDKDCLYWNWRCIIVG